MKSEKTPKNIRIDLNLEMDRSDINTRLCPKPEENYRSGIDEMSLIHRNRCIQSGSIGHLI